ncbi:MAG TPA: NAD(P)/FAD-dependent oxidoreductase [Burkholderiales bacterium]|nr:NAD(P)/FAD-dependent oxidoreductase [Burkholderiales bacterium]
MRTAEIIGGGFAGLAAACALAQRGWRVRLHERASELRTAGAGINVYENGLRVLEALGALEDTIRDGAQAKLRETRDQDDRLLSVHHWHVRVYGVLRQRMIDALAAAARRAGAEIITGSEGISASPDGQVQLASGERIRADLVVAADGVNSRLRDALDLVAVRRYLRDGCIRVLIPARSREEGLDTRTIEYWSGHRRLLYNPCNTEQLYLALSMPHDDEAGRAMPVDRALWIRSFPHLRDLIGRIGDGGRYDRFEYIRLKRWSAGRVAVIGDAAHALPPNIGQGAGCAMMNALSLAVYLDKFPEVEHALAAWEQAERPLTDHSQRISRLYGMPTFWPAPLRRMFYSLAGRSRWLTEQRTRTARHIPTGT